METQTWFTSDRHFGHSNIITYCNRPYRNTQEMGEDIIRKHNELVKPEDHVYDLGDFAFGRGVDYDYTLYCLTRMNGIKHFVRGNHDRFMDEIYLRQPELFASYERGYQEIEINNQRIVLCHYAMREWHHNLRGVWHLFGHTHGSIGGWGKSFDVGVDVHGFKPISFEQVKSKMDKLPVGEHGKFRVFS